jgi:hypothetical protein
MISRRILKEVFQNQPLFFNNSIIFCVFSLLFADGGLKIVRFLLLGRAILRTVCPEPKAFSLQQPLCGWQIKSG